jgi:hypothetical protein
VGVLLWLWYRYAVADPGKTFHKSIETSEISVAPYKLKTRKKNEEMRKPKIGHSVPSFHVK